MSKDQRINELQQKIEVLEMERSALATQLSKADYEFQQFTSQYRSITEDLSSKIMDLAKSIQLLKGELVVLQSAVDTPQPSVASVATEKTSVPDFTLNGVSASQNENKKIEVKEPEEQESYESCVSGISQSAVVADLKQKTTEIEVPQQNVVSEPVEETVKAESAQETVKTEPVKETTHQSQSATQAAQKTTQTASQAANQTAKQTQPKEDSVFDKIRDNFDWEKFIGENLIMKLGILIMLIGVAIGGKYAIDNDLLSPAMRMIIGVVFGAALQGVAIKLKSQYKKLSAVLASGSVAILYFMTFFSYHLYALIPMPVAFVAMVLITIATVWLACSYDMEIIALIGLVGAYVIPFALSKGEDGSPWILFSYISLINIGVMVIAVKRYWKKLFVSAFVASWFILTIVYRLKDVTATPDSVKMLASLFINFVVFYVTFLAYKVRRSMIFQYFDVCFLLSNSFLFFGLGYNVMFNNATLAQYVALFSFFNAVIHGVVAFFLIKKDMVDKSVSRMIAGLAISFLTIAIMVWMTGHWLTMFWMLEGTVLFTVSRLYQRPFYEKMSYPVLVLALVSLIIDWGNPNGGHLMILTPLFEAFAHYRSMWDVSTAAVQGSALSIINTIVFIALSIFIVVIAHRYPMVETEETQSYLMKLSERCLKAMSVFVVTTALMVHIEHPWLTMAWIFEATVLFVFSRKNNLLSYEKLSYPVFVLALFSLFADWGNPNQPNLDFFYIWYHLLAYNNTAEIFRVNIEAVDGSIVNYGLILSIINSVLFIVLSIFASVVEHRCPLVENKDTEKSWAKLASRGLTVMAILVLSLAFLVHIDQPWVTVCWSAEAVVLCYLGRAKSSDKLIEGGSFVLLALSTIAFLNAWVEFSNYGFLDFVFDVTFCRFSMKISNMWESVVAGLSLIAAIVNVKWLIYRYSPTNGGFAEAKGWDNKIVHFLVCVVAFFIWTHTPLIVTTILYFALAFACLIWTVSHDVSFKRVFYGVLLLAFVCWFLDVCNTFDGHHGHIVMLVASLVAVSLVCMMKRYNDNPQLIATKISLPFSPIIELIPFIALGVVILDKQKEWIDCFALTYFALWTFVSLKRKWNDFKVFSLGCMCLAILCKLLLGVIELKIDNAPCDISIHHFASLISILFSCYVLFLYKKTEKCVWELTESQTTKLFDSLLFFGSVIVVEKELNNLCKLVGSPESFGVSFSVLMGVVSLFGVYYGLYKDKKYLRIEGFILLGFTVLKLVFYDLGHFDTLKIVITCVSSGIFMLVVAFFYQKIAKEKAQEIMKNGEAQSEPEKKQETDQNEIPSEPVDCAAQSNETDKIEEPQNE